MTCASPARDALGCTRMPARRAADPAAGVRLGRAARALVVAGIVALTGAGCGKTKDGPAGFCGVIGIDVVGLDSIVSEDGRRSVATWVHVFVEGVTDTDEASRQAIATAVRSDEAGFVRVRDEAVEELRPVLDRLHEFVQDPEAVRAARDTTEVHADVDLVRRFAGPGGCDLV